jgi:rfaE bifunctional protein kinase chain/domain
VLAEVIGLAERVMVPVLVDPKFRSFDRYRKVKLFKPNYKELIRGLKLDLKKHEIEKLSKAISTFQKKQQIETILVTLSEHGILVSSDGSVTHIQAIVRDIADVSGAGDTVISVAALCLVSGQEAPAIAAISNLAGGQVCEKAGVVPVNAEKLLDECEHYFKSS